MNKTKTAAHRRLACPGRPAGDQYRLGITGTEANRRKLSFWTGRDRTPSEEKRRKRKDPKERDRKRKRRPTLGFQERIRKQRKQEEKAAREQPEKDLMGPKPSKKVCAANPREQRTEKAGKRRTSAVMHASSNRPGDRKGYLAVSRGHHSAQWPDQTSSQSWRTRIELPGSQPENHHQPAPDDHHCQAVGHCRKNYQGRPLPGRRKPAGTGP